MPVILSGKAIQNYFTAVYSDKWRVDNSVDNTIMVDKRFTYYPCIYLKLYVNGVQLYP